jgi:ABC-2 type transport system permease protein
MNWLMRWAPPASFAWLALNELRLAVRARSGNRRGLLARLPGASQIVGILLLLLWILIGCAIGWALRDTAIPFLPEARIGVLLASMVAMSFMTAQAILGSQRSLYATGDLALLFSAPISERQVLLAKLLGIAAAIALTYTILLMPVVVPVAILGHAQLFGLVALLAALALTAAAIGLALTLAIATLVGPRAARTVGQMLAALLGGAIFLGSQLFAHDGRRSNAMVAMFERLQAGGFARSGIGALPGRAAFGDPLAIVILLGGAVLLFVGAGATLQRLFLSGYQDGGNRLSRSKPTGRASARLFHAGLTPAIFAKEWRLLVRDPALAFQIVLRLVYMAPLVFALLGSRHALPVPPALAFASVLIASQMVGSFAWLTVSAEDAPDLLAVAPVGKDTLDWAKLLAAFAMAAPFAVVMPIAIALQTPLGAVITLAMTALGGGAAGYAELKLGKPGARTTFARRRQGGVVAGIASLLIAVIFGGGAAVMVFLVSGMGGLPDFN